MIFARRLSPAFGLVVSLAVFSSCAGGQLAKIVDAPMLPDEMAKFEVREVEPATPVVQPAALNAVPSNGDPALASAVAPLAAKAEAKAAKKKAGKKDAKKQATPEEKTAATTFEWPSRRPSKDPIWPAEQMVFTISYFGMPAGDFTLDVLPYKTVNNRKVYHIKGNAVSSSVFSMFYRLNDTIESYFDYDGLFSHRFHMVLDESKQTRNSLELNDSEKGQTYYWNRWNHHQKGYSEKKEFQPMIPFSQDSLSALYYIRTVKFPAEGESFSFPVISEGRNWEAVVTVMGREKVDTPMGKVMAVKLKPETKYAGVLKKSGDSFLWVTDDDRRVVVRLEAKVRIGTVVAALTKFQAGTQPQ